MIEMLLAILLYQCILLVGFSSKTYSKVGSTLVKFQMPFLGLIFTINAIIFSTIVLIVQLNPKMTCSYI